MIEMVIDARRKDLGGFEVGRVLPFHSRRFLRTQPQASYRSKLCRTSRTPMSRMPF